MSINDLVDEAQGVAEAAIIEAKAAAMCSVHPDVLIRHGDDVAERLAYAIATNRLKQDGRDYLREDVTATIADLLATAADGDCPTCAYVRAL